MRLTIGILLLTFAVAVFAYLRRGRPYFAWFRLRIDRRVASNLSISSSWTEIIPRSSLRPLKVHQRVRFVCEGFDYRIDQIGLHAGNPESITFADSSVATPEVEIEDQYGICYRLRLVERIGTGVEFMRRPNTTGPLYLPRDRVYRKIRIKSDQPFNCSQVIWHCYSMK